MIDCRNKTDEADPEKCSKYCIDHPWTDACTSCGIEIRMTYATAEVLGTYCEGCFGYPMCGCKNSHRGSCKDPVPK